MLTIVIFVFFFRLVQLFEVDLIPQNCANALKSLYELRPFRGAVGDDLERRARVLIFLRERSEKGGLLDDFHLLSWALSMNFGRSCSWSLFV